MVMPSRNKKKVSTDARGGKPAHPEKAKFLLAVDEAQKLAKYSGPVDADILEAAYRAMTAWRQLAEAVLTKSRSKRAPRALKPIEDRRSSKEA